MSKLIIKYIIELIISGVSCQAILSDAYLNEHLNEGNIQYHYKKAIDKIKIEEERVYSLLKHRITVRLDTKTYNLIKNNPSKRIRASILAHYGGNRDCQT